MSLKNAMRFIEPGADLPTDTLVLDSSQDVTRLTADLAGRHTVALHFAKWTDGRGYSQAVLLRARRGYTGDIVATGDVLADMLPLLRRCGFSAVQLRADQRLESAQRALGFFDGRIDGLYQRSTLAAAAGAA
jgi:uncharacterized protein (DUF934 family)